MGNVTFRAITAVLMVFAAGQAAPAEQVDISGGSVVRKVLSLKAGQYVWVPNAAPAGPMLLIVNLKSQRALLYRNGVPIGATTVSTGRPGYTTPTGVFTILQKHVEHYSSTYDNAPMPYMQRLTWRGVALHAGNLPGYPASHGCIRLPLGFAKLLYRSTKLGMTVVIANEEALPRSAPMPGLNADPSPTGSAEEVIWSPEASPRGPVSIIVSAVDKRAIVLRNGIQIGSAPVEISGPVPGTWAYALKSIENGRQNWIRVDISGAKAGGDPVPREEWQRFAAAEGFRKAVAGIVEPGTTIVVTPDSLRAGSTGTELTVIEEDPKRRK
jgi:hypothetical protein